MLASLKLGRKSWGGFHSPLVLPPLARLLLENQIPGGLGGAGDNWGSVALRMGNKKDAVVFDLVIVLCFPDLCFYL